MGQEDKKYKLSHTDYMTVYDMGQEELMKYTKEQLAHAVTQFTMELHDMECSLCD